MNQAEAIKTLADRLREEEADLRERKRMINNLAESYGFPPPFSGAEVEGRTMLRRDQFYSMTPALAAKSLLEIWGQHRGAVTLEQIREGLLYGGFVFTGRDQVHALKVALGKDGSFVRLPNETYGLRAWYPDEAERLARATEAFATALVPSVVSTRASEEP